MYVSISLWKKVFHRVFGEKILYNMARLKQGGVFHRKRDYPKIDVENSLKIVEKWCIL